MSIAITGKQNTNGLIFVCDRFNQKSYVGEPTTNLALFDVTAGFSTDTPSNVTQTVDNSVTYKGRSSLRLSTVTGYWNIYKNGTAYYTQTSSTTFTFSWKMKRADGTVPVIGGGYIYTVATSTYPSVTVYPIDDGWYQCFCSYSSTNSTPSLTGFNATQLGVFYITDWQVETKTHHTPYVYGTRSNTQGLVDLTRNSTLDLTNAGYDANAQFTFNGSSNYIIAPENSVFNTQTPSVEVWIKTNNTNQNGFFFEKGQVNTQYSLFQEGTVIQWRQYFSSGQGLTNLSTTTANFISTSNWAHVVGTFTSGTRRLYINGALANSDSQAGTIATNANGISIGVYGGYNGSRGYYYNGQIGLVRVYNRVLSYDEVLRNYSVTKRRYGL